ncbi:hypothetical protein QUF64_14020 [Anaerolineales bacterium HSG6]|nr:hypothetical protein [Anaerolineales bacterium HSG6]MDM8530931.1 hypothetical protein [Anaerolineales bacterium HSG25]
MIRRIYFGMFGAFSVPPLIGLLKTEAKIVAVVVPMSETDQTNLPQLQQPTNRWNVASHRSIVNIQ